MNVNDETAYSRYDLVADNERLMANGGFELHLKIKEYRSSLPLEPPQLTAHSYIAGERNEQSSHKKTRILQAAAFITDVL